MTLQLRATQDYEEFRAAVLPFLRAHASEYSQLLLACERLSPRSFAGKPYWLGALYEDDKVIAVGLYTSGAAPCYLSLSAWPPEAIPLLVEALAGHPVHALVGPRATAQAASLALDLPRLLTHLNNYVLEQAPASQTAQGRAESHSPERIPLLADWIVAFELECGFPPRDVRTLATMLELGLPPFGTRNFVFWMVGDKPVAMAAIALSAGIARIGPVYTPPEQRGYRYAAALVAQLASHAFTDGAQRVCLYADAANPASNSLYRRLGFLNLGEFAEYGR